MNLLTQAIEFQKKHDNIWNQDMANNEEYQEIKSNLIAHAKDCTAKIKHHESNQDSNKADEYIKEYSQVIEVYREFYHY